MSIGESVFPCSQYVHLNHISRDKLVMLCEFNKTLVLANFVVQLILQIVCSRLANTHVYGIGSEGKETNERKIKK